MKCKLKAQRRCQDQTRQYLEVVQTVVKCCDLTNFIAKKQEVTNYENFVLPGLFFKFKVAIWKFE